MQEATAPEQQLVDKFHTLAPWKLKSDFNTEIWNNYIAVARLIQKSDSNTVIAALDRFMTALGENEREYEGYEDESKLFILMRVIFEIPGEYHVQERFSYKGWGNWPEAGPDGAINLSWPVHWNDSIPELLNDYQGSMGQQYAASSEFRFLKSKFPYRKL